MKEIGEDRVGNAQTGRKRGRNLFKTMHEDRMILPSLSLTLHSLKCNR